MIENTGLPRWARLEQWLIESDLGNTGFRAKDYAVHGLKTSNTYEASRDIQAYLEAQRSPRSITAFTLKRMPGTRTAGAIWTVGERTADIRKIIDRFKSDVQYHVYYVMIRDIWRIRTINPRAKKEAERKITALIGGVLVVLDSLSDDLSESSNPFIMRAREQ